jgi:hypothetical protein
LEFYCPAVYFPEIRFDEWLTEDSYSSI